MSEGFGKAIFLFLYTQLQFGLQCEAYAEIFMRKGNNAASDILRRSRNSGIHFSHDKHPQWPGANEKRNLFGIITWLSYVIMSCQYAGKRFAKKPSLLNIVDYFSAYLAWYWHQCQGLPKTLCTMKNVALSELSNAFVQSGLISTRSDSYCPNRRLAASNGAAKLTYTTIS